jgi:thiopurine S-methyltransferase
MTTDYWLERWRDGRIGFHLADVNPLLVEHSAVLVEATRVLVPLCGKSADLEWLVTHGYQVVGVELVELAAQSFFAERGLAPVRREDGDFVVYEHGNLAIWVGDFFATTGAQLGTFDAAYDRAAMIALPVELRNRYALHLQQLLTPKARLLLVTLHFDVPGGPPFSVPPEEVSGAFPGAKVRLLASLDSSSGPRSAVQRGARFEHENVYVVTFGSSA